MLAYCCNNPVSYADFSGESFAIVIGINSNIFGLGGTGTINFVSTKENLGVQCSYYSLDDSEISKKDNQTIGIDSGFYIGIQYTEKDSMEELRGLSKATGGDLVLGLDILTDEADNYLGWQFGSSMYSANMHSIYTNTETIFSMPTIDVSKILVDWVFGAK